MSTNTFISIAGDVASACWQTLPSPWANACQDLSNKVAQAWSDTAETIAEESKMSVRQMKQKIARTNVVDYDVNTADGEKPLEEADWVLVNQTTVIE